MDITFPFDPIERSSQMEKIVLKDGKRLYFRFRASPYYGGIATADAVGCSFLCAYCWNYDRNLEPQQFDSFYSPQAVAAKLLNVAKTCSLSMFRISGSEPLLGEESFEQVFQVIRMLFRYRPNSIFILETNGFCLGANPELVMRLRVPNLRVRVCLKGIDEQSFEGITGVRREFFDYPLIALRELEKQGVYSWPALLGDFFPEDDIAQFQLLLKANHINSELEVENLEAQQTVIQNLKSRNLQFKTEP